MEELKKIAIVGTERKPMPEQVLHELHNMGIATTDASPAEIVLKGLAAHHLLRKASGNLLQNVDYKLIPPSPAPNGSFRQCPPFIADIIRKILNLPDFHEALLPEVLRLLWQQKVDFPREHIPSLLEKCYRDAGLMAEVANYLDEQVAWVASLQPRWACLLPSTMNDWHTAAYPERQKILQYGLRRLPEAARAALLSTWSTEKAEHKVRFLEILSDYLHDGDLPLLETALADTQQLVRLAAAKYLRLLPGNSLTARAESFFEQHYGLVFKGKANDLLGVALSDEHAPDIQYFMSFLDKYRKVDWRWNVFLQVMAAIPPHRWSLLTEQSLATMIKRVRKTDQFNAAPFVSMVADVAAAFASVELVKAILEECADLFYHQEHHVWSNEVMCKLLMALPDTAWAEIIDICLAKNYSFAWKALAERPGTLSPTLVTPALLYLKAQSSQMTTYQSGNHQLLSLLKHKFAYFVEIEVAIQSLSKMEETLQGDMPDFVQDIRKVLALRRQIASAL